MVLVGQQNYEAKFHWASWFKMTESKSCGGIGFRDLNLFNVALLSKIELEIVAESRCSLGQSFKKDLLSNLLIPGGKKG